MEEQLLLDCTFVKVTASNMTYDPDEGLMFDVDVENKTDDCSLRVGFGSWTLSDEHMPWEFSSDVPGESIHARIGADAERLKYLADHFGGEEGRRKELRDLSLDIDIYLKKDGEEMRVVPYPDGECRIVSSFSKEAAACPEVVLSEKVLLDTDELKVTLTGDTTCSTAAVMGANLLVENKTDGPIGFRAAFNRANEFSIDGGTVSLYSSVSIYNEDANLAIPAGAAKEYTALAFLKGLSEIGVHDIGSLGLHIIAETPVEDPSEEGSGKLYYVGQYFMDEVCEIQTDNAGKAEETSFADGTVLYDQDGVRLVSRASADQMIIYA
ncbi:MAG: hypothetical protein K6B72_10525, partial [Lachnospiraceae bacterium]|nr:hypothetical protein [Lachnospiraceae bacterium]